MAQGTRGRLALLGTGLLVCLGCMPDEKPIGGKSLPPKGQLGSTVKPNIPQGTNQFGSGVQPASFNSPAGLSAPPRTNTPALPTGGMNSPVGLTPNSPPANSNPLGNAQPTYPPANIEAFPPAAPGANGLPIPPTVPPGAGALPSGR